jgi:hypothetical protein
MIHRPCPCRRRRNSSMGMMVIAGPLPCLEMALLER